MQHRNAPLTPNGRRRLVALVEEEGFTFEVDCPHLGHAMAASRRGRAPQPGLPAGSLLTPPSQPEDAQRRRP
jgi:hypothetical protein